MVLGLKPRRLICCGHCASDSSQNNRALTPLRMRHMTSTVVSPEQPPNARPNLVSPAGRLMISVSPLQSKKTPSPVSPGGRVTLASLSQRTTTTASQWHHSGITVVSQCLSGKGDKG